MDKGYSGLNPFKQNNDSLVRITQPEEQESEIEPMRVPQYVLVVKPEDVISEPVEKAIKGHPFAHPKHSPFKIPSHASVKKESKKGYEQVKYTWRKGEYRYESRWHTATPNAPNKKQSWVVSRTKRGSGAVGPTRTVLSGKKWVSWDTWHAAIAARNNGTATKAQIKLLNEGHFTRKRGKK